MFRPINKYLSPWAGLHFAAESDGGGEAVVEPPAVASPAPAGVAPTEPAAQGGTTAEPPAATTFLDEGAEETAPAAVSPPAEPIKDFSSFTFPEGFSAPEGEAAESFLSIINDRALTPQEQGQRLINYHAQALANAQASAQDGIAQQWDELQTQWKAACSAELTALGVSPSVGQAQINKGLRAAGADDETFEALRVTGAANNPKIVGLLFRLSKPFVEGGQVAGATVRTGMTQAERLQGFYNHPTSQPQKG